MTETKTILSLAQEIQAQLTTSKRANGDEFVHFKDTRPQWMRDFVRAIHGDKLPDDYTYDFIGRAIDAIVDAEPETADEAREAVYNIEPDPYTSDLMAWLAENYEYCEEAIREYGVEIARNFIGLVGTGQQQHITKVGNAVIVELEKLAE